MKSKAMHSTFIYLSALILLGNLNLFSCNLMQSPIPAKSKVLLKHVNTGKCVEINSKSRIVLRKCSKEDDHNWVKTDESDSSYFTLKNQEKVLSSKNCQLSKLLNLKPFNSEKNQYWKLQKIGFKNHGLIENRKTGNCLIVNNNEKIRQGSCDPENKNQIFIIHYVSTYEETGRENFINFVVPIRYRPAIFTIRPNPSKIKKKSTVGNVLLKGSLKHLQGRNNLSDEESNGVQITLINLKTHKKYKANIENSKYFLKVPQGKYNIEIKSNTFETFNKTLNLNKRQIIKPCLLQKLKSILPQLPFASPLSQNPGMAYLVGNTYPGQLLVSENGQVNYLKHLGLNQ